MNGSYFKKIGIAALGFAFTLIAFHTVSYTNNPPLARTGAPGEGNCTGCHSGTAVTSGTSFNNLELSTSMLNQEYIPDSTYKITIDYTESGKSKFGFMTTTLTSSGNNRAGSYTVTNSTKTARNTTSVNSKTREYIYQKSGGTSGSGGTSWDFEWTAPSANLGDVKFYVALNSSNNGNNSSGDKIILKSFEFEPSSKLPTASIASLTTVCIGDTLLLDGTGSKQETNYTWKVNGGAWTKNKKDSVIKAVWSKAGDFKVTLTTANSIGVSEQETVTIKVLNSPSADVSFSPNDTVCAGGEISIKALDGASWKWSDNSTNERLKVTKTANLSLEVTGTNGCIATNSDINPVVIEPGLLSLNGQGVDSLCETDSLQLTATSGFALYEYYVNNQLYKQSATNSFYFKQPFGEYRLAAKAKNTFGCESQLSNELKIIVSPKLNGPDLNCSDISIEEVGISWPPQGPANQFEISIDSGKTWVPSNGFNGQSHLVDGLSSQTVVDFWARGITNGPCKYTTITSQTCTTKSCFTADFRLLNDSVCLNAENGSLTIADIDIDKYSISFNNGAFEKDTTFIYDPVNLGVGAHKIPVSIIDSNALSCPSYKIEPIVRVNPLPKPVILNTWQVNNGQSSICMADQPIVLEGNNIEDGNPYLNILWTGRGTRQLGGGRFEFNPVVAGSGIHTLTYEATNIYGCLDKVTEDVKVDSAISAFFTKEIDQRLVKLNADVSGAKTWKWYFSTDNGDSSSARNPSFYFNKDGTYEITLVTADPNNVCPDVSYTDSVTVLGGSVNYLENGFAVFPNPVKNQLFIQHQHLETASVRVYNVNGLLIQDLPNYKIGSPINLERLEGGIYLVTLNSNNIFYKKVIVK